MKCNPLSITKQGVMKTAFISSLIRRPGWIYGLAILACLPSCRVTDLPLWGPAGAPAADGLEVKEIRSVAYYAGPDADDYRHRLDLFVPKDRTNFPVVVLVHGGAWMLGDNRSCGLYTE